MQDSLIITVDDLSDGQIEQLLASHMQEMRRFTPPESIHALTNEQLMDPKLTFWGARLNGKLVGCCALKQLTSISAEIKSMKTHPDFTRRGIARSLIENLMTEAAQRSCKTLFLETGRHQAFQPAIQLYKQFGFAECGPFGDYQLAANSLFMTRLLET